MKHSAPVALMRAPTERELAAFLAMPWLPRDLEPDALGRELHVPGQPGAVDLLVVEDEGRVAVLLLGERGDRRALVGVLREDARVRPLARGVVLLRLAGLGAGIVGRDPDGG